MTQDDTNETEPTSGFDPLSTTVKQRFPPTMNDKWKRKSRKMARQMYWEKHDRDEYRCPDCGRSEDELESGFEVHHKDGQPMDNRPENHVALCRLCHNLREGKKPSLEAIRNLRDHSGADTEPQDGQDTVAALSLLSEYNGEYGAVVCPGCGEKLGVAESAADIHWTHHCCGVDNREVPTAVVVDNDKRDSLPKDDDSGEKIQPSILKQWLVQQWVDTVLEKTAVQITQREHVGWDDGEPIIIERPSEMDISGVTLVEVKHIAEQWGWDEVAHVAGEAAECPEPAQGFKETLEVTGFFDKGLSGDEVSMVSLGELTDES